MNKQQRQLMQDAVNEIRTLRRQNEIMMNRLDVYDSMMSLFNSTPFTPPQCMSQDKTFEMEKHIANAEMLEKQQNGY